MGAFFVTDLLYRIYIITIACLHLCCSFDY